MMPTHTRQYEAPAVRGLPLRWFNPNSIPTVMKIRSLILSAALLLLAAACSKNTKETATTKDGTQVTMEKKGDQATMEIQTKSGEKVTLSASDKGVKPATELPKDLPVYPKAVLKMDNTVGPMRMLGFYTSDPVADAVKFYTDEFKKQGWTIDNSMAMGEGYMLNISKDKRSCQAMITKDGKETYVQFTLGAKN